MNKDYSKEMKIEKSLVECYRMRDGYEFADFTIDAHEHAGRVSVASSYGSFEYYWGACGCPLKEFLGRIDMDYAARKFGQANWFDLDKTIVGFQSQVDEEKEFKAQTWLEIIQAEINYLKSASCKEELNHMLWEDSPELMSLCDHQPDVQVSIDPHFKTFWNKFWLPFVEYLKEELK